MKEVEAAVQTARLHELYIVLLRAATSARTDEADIARWRDAACALAGKTILRVGLDTLAEGACA